MNILKAPIESVIPWDKNPRGIKTKDYERLKKQILKLGVYKPLIAFEDKGKYVVLGGNMRIRALKELGIKDVEISVVKPTSEAQKIEFALSDNDRAGFYEEDKLAELVYPHIKDIDLGDFKVDLGEALDLKQVVERYGPDIDDGADEVPEIDDTPAITKMGDLFTLGKHRLLCGDSTKAEDVARLMRGEKADMVFTDPPYNINYEYRDYKDNKTDAEYLIFVSAFISSFMPFLGESCPIYIMSANNRQDDFKKIMADNGVHFHQWLYWVKPNPGYLGRSDYIQNYETINYGYVGKHKFFGKMQVAAEIVARDAGHDKVDHPAQRPIALVEKCLKNSSEGNGLIYDSFLGSGSTLIAAEKLNRTCMGMEIDPKYCDVIIKRYADYVGVEEKAIRKTVEHGK